MHSVNRGYIIIQHLPAYFEWANQFVDLKMSMEDNVEKSLYLIEEEFMDIDPVMERNFKKIFAQELEMIQEDETKWPEKLTFELFNEWFAWDYGAMAFDLEKTDLKREKI